MATKELDTVTDTCVKLIIQQCVSAKLKVISCQSEGAGAGAGEEGSVSIEKGIVVYVSFLKSANIESAKRAANTALNVKLTYEETTGKLQSALDTESDMLVVPQACLGGKLKGKSFQYHNLLGKDVSRDLYQGFLDESRQLIALSDSKGSLKHGTYGIRQVLQLETVGPFTHIIDIQ